MNEPRDRVKDEERWEERFCPACGGRHMARVRPAYQFYPNDEERETGLRLVSLSAYGLWKRMLNVMQGAVPRGWLVGANGKAIEPAELARLVDESPATVKKLLAELETHHVFKRTGDGIIECRRMVRDEHISNVRAASGKKGGNPDLVNQEAPESLSKPRELLNQNGKQNPTPSSSTSDSASASSPSSVSPASSTATANGGAHRSSSSSRAASAAAAAHGSTETVPVPRSAAPPAALLEPGKQKSNGRSEPSAPPTTRDAKSAIVEKFIDEFYNPADGHSEERRKDVRRGLKRLLLGKGEKYKGRLLHATLEELQEAIRLVEEAMPLDDDDKAWPFALGCIAEMRDNASFLSPPATAAPAVASVMGDEQRGRIVEEWRQTHADEIREIHDTALKEIREHFPRAHAEQQWVKKTIDERIARAALGPHWSDL